MRFPVAAVLVILGPILVGCAMSQAPETGATSDVDLKKEATSADSLFKSQNLVGALPLYEDLHKREPESNVWRERLAGCLLGAAANQTPEVAATTRERARKLLLDIVASGQSSNMTQILLEKLNAPVAAAQAGPVSPGAEAMKRAEKAFTSGDLPGALKGYEDAMAADPKMYEAPLFAGDTEYKQGHFAEADQWYAQAVAINPNRETAYRYWGDCLMKQGETIQAEGKFIDAVIAEPYQRTPRVGLKQWADATHAILMAPAITLPARPKIATSDKDGFITSMTVGIDPAVMAAYKDSPVLPSIMAYEMGSTIWVSGMFHKTYPTEKQYRHSLGEEAQSIRVALSTLAKANLPPEKVDTTWRTLAELDKDGMLECWILLDHPDQGIAQDYVAYRTEHRDLLHAYIAKYDVHPR